VSVYVRDADVCGGEQAKNVPGVESDAHLQNRMSRILQRIKRSRFSGPFLKAALFLRLAPPPTTTPPPPLLLLTENGLGLEGSCCWPHLVTSGIGPSHAHSWLQPVDATEAPRYHEIGTAVEQLCTLALFQLVVVGCGCAAPPCE
jgi:hypothetical protein